MRNDLETREIADAELDAVAGGVAAAATGLVGAVATDLTNAVNSLETVGYVQGLAGQATGQVAGLTGVNASLDSVTGLAGL